MDTKIKIAHNFKIVTEYTKKWFQDKKCNIKTWVSYKLWGKQKEAFREALDTGLKAKINKKLK